jgi:uncharacterized protein YndB with AHSA1/START domain
MTEDNRDDRLVVRRLIAASREELFDAWTDPKGMAEWMCPGNIASAEVELDPRPGGALRVVMRSPTEQFDHRGEFKIVERPAKLVFTWISRGTGWLESLVTIELRAVNDSETELVLTHENLPGKEVRDRHQGGWSQIVALLEGHLLRERG